jgi:N-acetylglucosamine kinase-like BadF-type ATPase
VVSATVGRVPRPRVRRPARGRGYVVAVDGGNSKTDVVIAGTDGTLLAWARGSGVESPLADPSRWRQGLLSLVADARRRAGLGEDARAACAAFFLANVDLPDERRHARRVLTEAGLADTTVVHNDAVAVLRAGATQPWGVAVVAGAGINAVGVHPSGRVARFLAFGDYTGDSGGGHHLGVQGLGAAIRARDARGPATSLAIAVPAYFGLRTAEEVAIAVHRHDIAYTDLHVLAPVVLAAAADGDEVARRVVDAFADEVATMVVALIRRLHLTRTDLEVVLGGSVLQSVDGDLVARIGQRVVAVAARARLSVLAVPPVFGALVEAFGQIGGDRQALHSLRARITNAGTDRQLLS